MVFLPGFIIGMLQKRWKLPRAIALRSVAELGIISMSLLIGLPMTIAAYSIEGQIKLNKLERNFQNYTMANGEKT